MKEYTFIGHVYPYFKVHTAFADGKSADPNKPGSIQFEIKDSIVIVVLQVNDIESPVTALKSAEQVVQGQIDAYTFIHGGTYEIKLEHQLEDGVKIPFVEPTFKDLLPNTVSPNITYLMAQGVHCMSMRFALSNFKNARRYTSYTGFFIYLAIENIKKNLVKDEKISELKQWEILRNTLSLERADIDFAKQYADNVRHGKYSDVSGKDNTAMLCLGAKAISAFHHFLLSQDGSLN